MRKLILIGLMIFLLSSFVSALDYNGVACSTDPTLYHYYNSSGGTQATPGIPYIVVGNIDTASSQEFVVMVENFKDDAGNVQWSLVDSSNNYLAQLSDTGGNWKVSGSNNDMGISYVSNTYMNATHQVDFSDNSLITTVNNSGVNGQVITTVNNVVDLDKVYFNFAGSSGSWGGLFVWNCTGGDCGCPSAAVPANHTDSINISSPLPPNNSVFKVDTVAFNLTANSSFTFNATLYIDGVSNLTNQNSAGENIFVNFSQTFPDADYKYIIQVDNGNLSKNTTAFDFRIDTVDPDIVVDSRLNDGTLIALDDLNTTFNYYNINLQTINITLNDNQIFYNGSVGLANFSVNVSEDLTGYSSGIQYLWTEACDQLNCVNATYNFSKINVSNVFESNVVQGQENDIILIVDGDFTQLNNINATLHYNNTNFETTGTLISGDYYFNVSLFAPTPSALNESINFNWTLNANENQFNTSSQTQTVFQSFLTSNCSIGYPAVNIYVSEEDYLTWLVAQTIDVDLTYTSNFGNTSNILNLGKAFTNTYNASICLYPPFAQFTVDAYIINTVAEGYSQRYYLVNSTFSNNTATLNVYNFNNTNKNSLSVNIVDEFFNPQSDVIVKLLRYYPAGVHANTSVNYAHSWQTVQVDKSDEFGETVFHVSTQGDTDYSFIMELNNVVIKETATLKLLCPDPTNCEITFEIATLSSPSAATPFDDYTFSYNETTEMITVTWSDSTLLTDTFEFLVAQEKLNGRNIICSQSFNTPSGSFSCNTSGYNGVISVNGYREASPVIKFLDETIDKVVNEFADVLSSNGFNSSGAFWSAIISMAIISASATSVIGVVFASIIALIVVMGAGLTNIVTMTFLIAAIIIALIISLRLRR